MHIWRKQHTHSHRHTCAPKASPRTVCAWQTTSWHTHTHTHTQVHSVDSIYQHRGESICWKPQRIERLEHTSPSSFPLAHSLFLTHSLSFSVSSSLWALQQGIAQDWTPLLHLPLLYFNRFCPSSNPSLLLWQPLLLAAEGYFNFHIGALRELLFAQFSHNSVCVCECVCERERESVCVCELGGGGGEGRREGQHLKTVSETLLTYNTHTHAHITVCLDLWLPCLWMMFAEGWFYETHTPVVLCIEHAMSSFIYRHNGNVKMCMWAQVLCWNAAFECI